MTNIEQKALEMVNEVSLYKCENVDTASHKDLCIAFRRAIEQHEAFRQKVSDALHEYFQVDSNKGWGWGTLERFIIPAPKPDPLVEIIGEINDGPYVETRAEYADRIRAALDALGFEIRKKNDG